MNTELISRYKQVINRIETACKNANRKPEDVMLVAVSKTKPNEDVLKLIKERQFHFGENRAKALEDRMESIGNEEAIWHFIGNLQTNKIKYMVHRVNWIQSIHKKKALKEVEKRATEFNRIVNVLIQINISKEDQKGGCDPEQLKGMLEYAQDLKYTKVCGLMGMATFADDPETVRPEFKLLKQVRNEHKYLNGGSVDLKHLSMGMTNDLEVAIQEGSTMVRIGAAIFGERNY